MVRSPLSYATAPVGVAALLVLQTAPVLPEPGWRAFGAAIAVASALLGIMLGGHRVRVAGACGVLAVAAALWAGAAHRGAARLEERLAPELEGVELAVEGVIDALPVVLERGRRFTLRVERCETVAPPGGAGEADRCSLPPRLSLAWQAALPGRADVPTPGAAAMTALRAGDRWSLTVRLRRPHAPVNPGAFDRELRWVQEGIGAVGTVRAGRLLDADAGGLSDRIERLRGVIRDGLYDAVSPARAREAGVLAALAIGDQAAIDLFRDK